MGILILALHLFHRIRGLKYLLAMASVVGEDDKMSLVVPSESSICSFYFFGSSNLSGKVVNASLNSSLKQQFHKRAPVGPNWPYDLVNTDSSILLRTELNTGSCLMKMLGFEF